MMATAIGMRIKLNLPYPQAVQKTTDALKAEGFGVLTQIDRQATLKQKLDIHALLIYLPDDAIGFVNDLNPNKEQSDHDRVCGDGRIMAVHAERAGGRAGLGFTLVDPRRPDPNLLCLQHRFSHDLRGQSVCGLRQCDHYHQWRYEFLSKRLSLSLERSCGRPVARPKIPQI